MKRLVLSALVVAPLILGGVHALTALAIGAVLCVASVMGLRERRARVQRQGIYVSAWALVATALALTSMLQLIPLPAWVHALLQPRGHLLYTQGAEAFALGDAPWRALSMDPGATAQAALRWWVLALAAFVGINFYRSLKHLRPLLWGMSIAAGACLLLGAAQMLTGTKLQLWWFDVGVAPRGVSTFVSLNHASAFYGLVAVAGATLVTLTPVWERARVLGACVTLVGAALAIFHGSVATIVTLGLCLFGFALWNAFADRGVQLARRAMWGALGLGGLGVVAALVLIPEVASGMHGARLELTRAGLQAIPAYPWIGAGGGAVERVIYPFVSLERIGLHAVPVLENDLIEVALSVGVLLSIAIATFLAWAGWRWGQRVREAGPRPLFVCVGLWGLYCALTALVHFPSRMMGLAIPMLLVGTALNATALSSARDAQPKPTRLLSLRVGWGWVLGAGIGMLVSYGVSHLYASPRDRDIDRLERVALELLVPTIPGEGRLYLRGANLALAKDDAKTAVRLGEHALRLEPYPHTRLLLARSYAKAGDQASAREAYAALLQGPRSNNFPRWIDAMWTDLEPGLERDAMVAALPTSLWPKVYTAGFRLRGRLESASLVDQLLEANPDRPEAVRQWLLFYEAIGEWEMVELGARDILVGEPAGPVEAEARAAIARALYARGRPEDGAQTLASVSAAFPEHVEIHVLVLRATTKRLDPQDVLAARVERARAVVCRGDDGVTHAHLCARSRAWSLERKGELERAGEILRGVAMKSKRPKEALEFMVRHNQCLALRKFRAEWRTRFPKKSLRAFDAARKDCQGS